MEPYRIQESQTQIIQPDLEYSSSNYSEISYDENQLKANKNKNAYKHRPQGKNKIKAKLPVTQELIRSTYVVPEELADITYKQISQKIYFFSCIYKDFKGSEQTYLPMSEILEYFNDQQNSLKFSLKDNKLKFEGLMYNEKDPEAYVTSLRDRIRDKFLVRKEKYHEEQCFVVAEGIKRMGFKNTKENKEKDKATYLYAINDNGNDCAKEWATFPVLVVLKNGVIDLKIIFAINSKPFGFTPNQLKVVKAFIRIVNKKITDYSFHYDAKKKHTYFRITQHLLYPPSVNIELPQRLTSEAIHFYTSYGYGLFRIFNEEDKNIEGFLPYTSEKDLEFENSDKFSLREIIKECEKRCDKPITVFSLTFQGLSHIKTFLKVSESIEAEIEIIKRLRGKILFEKVFAIDSIKIDYNVSYPVYYQSSKENNYENYTRKNPDIYQKLLKLVEELAEHEIKVKIKKFLESSSMHGGEIFYVYKFPLSKILSILPNVEKTKYLGSTFDKINLKLLSDMAIIPFKKIIHNSNSMLMKDAKSLEELSLDSSPQNKIYHDETMQKKKFLNSLVISNGIYLNDIIIDFEYEYDPICKKFNYFGMDIEKETIQENTNLDLTNESEIVDLVCKRYLLNLYFREDFVFVYIGLLDRFTILFQSFNGNKIITEISKNPLLEKELGRFKLYKLSEEIFNRFAKAYDALVSKPSQVPGFLPDKVRLEIDSEFKLVNLKAHLLTYEEVRLPQNKINALTFFSHEFEAGFVSENSMRSSIVKLLTLVNTGDPHDEQETINLNLPNLNQTLQEFEMKRRKKIKKEPLS